MSSDHQASARPENVHQARWNLIGGLIEGVHFPKGKYDHKPFVDLSGCKGIIIVSSKYFLENKALIETWCMEAERHIMWKKAVDL
jgi:hypothetical protein